MTKTVFITGTNRGLGFEFTKQYAMDGWKTYASCRNPDQALNLKKLASKFPNVEILKLDVSSESDIKAIASKIQNLPIDILINNAGVIEKGHISLESITQLDTLGIFTVNSIGPLLVSRALLPNLNLGKMKVIASLTSILGSLTANIAGEWNHYAYKASKSALNMFMRSLSTEPAFSDFRVLLLDPGWVKTDMGGENAELEPQESVSGLRSVLIRNDIASGTCINYKGDIMPW